MTTFDEMTKGCRSALPSLFSALPFGVLFGVVATERGLSIAEAMMMSITIYAGASQLVGIELFQHNVAPWVIILSILAVNFRHVLYSAALARHVGHFSTSQKAFGFFMLVDALFAEGVRRGETGTRLTFGWYLGFALTFYIPWQFATLAGAVFGNMIGDLRDFGLDVLLSIFFMGLVFGFRRKDNWLVIVGASSAASVLAWHFVGSPWHITIGAFAGIALAALLPLKDEAKA